MTGVDLTFADLTGADLSGANLSGVELFESILFKTILIHANLSRADLRGADLREADLSGAFLDNAFLSGANLTFADLTGASLDFTDLRFATWIDGGICDFTSIGACNISDDNASPCDTIALASDNIIKCLLPTVVKEVCADPCPADLALVEEGCGECTMTDPEDLVISVDLVDIFNQASSATSLDLDVDTPIAILAWGGEGGIGTNDLLTSGGDGGASGFASTVTTLSDFQDSFGQTTFFYYLAEAGDFGLTCGIGGASTLVMLVENSPGSLDDVLLIAGGGGGAEQSGTLSPGQDGGQGGIAAASVISMGFIGVGQGTFDGAEGGSTDGDGIGGSGGSSDADGHDGIGGEGGNPNGVNTQWLNGDPGVGSNGQGGESEDLDGCGGGGGYGGGGVGDEAGGTGGGSWAHVPTSSCSLAPNFDTVPSNPGTIGDGESSNESSNGAVEVWIFADGC